jgi:hypothetical protein
MWEMGLESVADARKVSCNGSRFNMMQHKHHKKTQSIRSGINGKTMKFAKGEVRLQVRVVSLEGGKLDCMAECDGALMQELLTRPGRLWRLPVSCYGSEHYSVPPITSRGGLCFGTLQDFGVIANTSIYQNVSYARLKEY